MLAFLMHLPVLHHKSCLFFPARSSLSQAMLRYGIAMAYFLYSMHLLDELYLQLLCVAWSRWVEWMQLTDQQLNSTRAVVMFSMEYLNIYYGKMQFSGHSFTIGANLNFSTIRINLDIFVYPYLYFHFQLNSAKDYRLSVQHNCPLTTRQLGLIFQQNIQWANQMDFYTQSTLQEDFCCLCNK